MLQGLVTVMRNGALKLQVDLEFSMQTLLVEYQSARWATSRCVLTASLVFSNVNLAASSPM